MKEGSSPASKTSRCSIVYRKSSWSVHHFEVWSGELLCRAAALRGEGWLLLWVGVVEPRLDEVALGWPGKDIGRESSTALIGGEGMASSLARRLAARLARPVYVCLGATFDKFTAPLVEKGLILEIKSRPECF